MIDHISLYVKNYEASKKFYEEALTSIGYKVQVEYLEGAKVAWIGDNAKAQFWIIERDNVAPTHIAFRASSQAQVDQFYKDAIAAGGKDNGAAGYRKDYSPTYYAAFVLDPDGNNIEVVHWR